MRIGPRASAAALGVAIVVVAGAGVAKASGADPVLLGHNNTAEGTTTIKSSGTPLALKGDADSPPLKVSSLREVKNLNSQYLNGKTAAQIAAAGIAASGAQTDVVGRFSDFGGFILCPTNMTPAGGGVLPDVTTADDVATVDLTFAYIDGSNNVTGWEGVASDSDGSYDGTGFLFVTCVPGTVHFNAAMAAAVHARQNLAARTLNEVRGQQSKLTR